MKKYKKPNNYKKKITPSLDKVLGYLYFLDKEHPLSSKHGKTWHHRHIASLKLRRWIKPSEIVHHKDGNKQNNSFENLQIIKSHKDHALIHIRENGYNPKVKKRCRQCGKYFFSSEEKLCSLKCSGLNKRLFNISKSELKKMIWEKPMIYIAKHFKVSDSAILKRCRLLKIEKPHRGYWAKKNGHTKWSGADLTS